MWTVTQTVGKLVEARIRRADSTEITACLNAIASTVARAPGAVAGVLDLSQESVLARPEAELFLSVMRDVNPRVARTAILVSGDALLEMQIERLVRTAGSSQRSVFRAADAALRWLSQALTATEAARARDFFAESARLRNN
jgi:hypothetical protein